MPRIRSNFAILALVVPIGTWMAAGGLCPAAAEEWRNIRVANEHRCSPYDRNDYRYPPNIELQIIASQTGRVYGPYTGRTFASRRQTDIEHIVAASEAHDSGLCAASPQVRQQFATDLLNLTLATPEINRCGREGKCAYDAAEWLPPLNRCWFVGRIIRVRQKYDLSIDVREARAIDAVLEDCDNLGLVVLEGEVVAEAAQRPAKRSPQSGDVDALARWDDNGNWRITCKEARGHGIAPVPRDHPAYPFMHDADGDGVVCE